MSNLSVKNRVKLINSKFVGSTKGFNNLPMYQKNNNTNNTWNVNNVIPENFYVSPPNSPTGLNSPVSVASNVGSIGSFAPAAPAAVAAAAEDPVNVYMPPVEHNYAANIAAWKSRNTTKNKKYKTRANYNSKNRANLKAQLAQLSQHTAHYNNSGEEHSAQYWQNKRAANAASKAATPSAKTVSKWAPVPTGKLIRTRKNRKSRKNRK